MIEVFTDAGSDLTERRVCLRPDETEVLLSGGPARIVRSGGRLLRGHKAVNNLRERVVLAKCQATCIDVFVDAARSNRLYLIQHYLVHPVMQPHSSCRPIRRKIPYRPVQESRVRKVRLNHAIKN